LNNSVEALKDWFLVNGLWDATLTADGRVLHPPYATEGNWWIENNIFYFTDPDGTCVDYKAFKLENDQLYLQTDAPYTIMTRWYDRCGADGVPCLGSIVGSWGPGLMDGDYLSLTFYANGSYIVYHHGVEYGTYTHDNSTGQFTIDVVEDSNGEYGLADSGAPYQDQVIVNGDTLSFYYSDGTLEASFQRVTSDSSPIVGGWGPGCLSGENECLSLTFYANGYYIVYDHGVEYGTYSITAPLNHLTLNVLLDENGMYGLADGGLPTVDQLIVNADSLLVWQGGMIEATFERVK